MTEILKFLYFPETHVCLKGCIDPDSPVWLGFSLVSLVSLTFRDVNALYFLP